MLRFAPSRIFEPQDARFSLHLETHTNRAMQIVSHHLLFGYGCYSFLAGFWSPPLFDPPPPPPSGRLQQTPTLTTTTVLFHLPSAISCISVLQRHAHRLALLPHFGNGGSPNLGLLCQLRYVSSIKSSRIYLLRRFTRFTTHAAACSRRISTRIFPSFASTYAHHLY
jgi:hypothetical protein